MSNITTKKTQKSSMEKVTEFLNSSTYKEFLFQEDMKLALAIRIKQIRQKNNWSQEEMAKRTGLKQSYLSGLESGKRTPSFNTLAKICEVIGGRVEIIY